VLLMGLPNAFSVRSNKHRHHYKMYEQLSEISGSHGGEYKDGCLVGCCAV
jgi:hypothetical protein